MNKNKIKVVTTVPASMSNFEDTSNPHLTKAKLRVFHSGKTNDGRYFTDSFAEKLVRTIGGTPVVARYDSETEDFEGHAYNQYVYGFVPEDAAVEVNSDSTGKSWFTTEVRLFTERRDVGEVARKIIGHSQSLELNPETIEVEYRFEGDELEEIKFLDGDLIGLSVLGLSQQPAFEGSAFFEKTTEEERESTLAEIIAKYISIPKEIEIEAGGETMDRVVIYEGNGFSIFRKEKRIYIEEQGGTLDDITDALKDEEEEIIVDGPDLEPNEGEGDGDDNNDPIDPEDNGDPIDGDNDGEGDGEGNGDGDNGGTEGETTGENDGGTGFEELEEEGTLEDEDDAFIEGSEDPVEPVVLEVGEKGQNVEEEFETNSEGVESKAEVNSANETTLNKEEREELENYRREDKKRLISEYEEYLSEDELQSFLERVDTFEIAELEKELAFASMQAIRKGNKNEKQNTFAFNISAQPNNADDSVSRLIEIYKDKE